MSTSRNLDAPSGFTPADIYFVLFRHKWKILLLTLAGLAAAAVYYFTCQPPYQSDAELFIRYVSDNRAVNPSDNNARVTSLIDMGQNVMNSESRILSSRDLASAVATNIGPEKILALLGGGKDPGAAAGAISGNLKVTPIPDSSVIYLTFHHPDPDLVRPILAELIAGYEDKHLQVHKAIGMTDDTLADEASQLLLQIAQTENELRIVKTNAGIISVADAEKSYSEESGRIRRELLEARTSLAEHPTGLRELDAVATKPLPTNALVAVPADQAARYKSVCVRLDAAERRQNDYIQQGYTDDNKLLKENRDLLAAATKEKADLEKAYPSLVEVDKPVQLVPATPSPAAAETTESAAVAALLLRVQELQAQFNGIQAEAAKLDEAEAKIADLERRKGLQENNYKYFVSMLEQARIDEALGPGRVSNIQVIQQPSAPYRVYAKFYKVLGMMAFGGLLAGLAWACLIEFYLDRSVKRPVDLHTRLRIPFFLSIPDLNHGARHRLGAPARSQLTYNGAGAAAGGTGLEVASPTINHALHSHYDALRDRLVNYFESINLTRKPKLVAITSTSKGAGVSTISAGLAASLSETGDGRVLLVDMNLENGAAQQFVHGKPGCQLDDALASEKRDNALVQENLYVVSEGSNADKLPRVLPKRFASLMPKLKASDYDYIIFDMPPVSQTSITIRLAGFMDTVMLVVESEKTDRDVVLQANQLLVQAKANVTTVLNKTRKYIPARLQHDIQADM